MIFPRLTYVIECDGCHTALEAPSVEEAHVAAVQANWYLEVALEVEGEGGMCVCYCPDCLSVDRWLPTGARIAVAS